MNKKDRRHQVTINKPTQKTHDKKIRQRQTANKHKELKIVYFRNVQQSM